MFVPKPAVPKRQQLERVRSKINPASQIANNEPVGVNKLSKDLKTEKAKTSFKLKLILPPMIINASSHKTVPAFA